MNKNRSGPEFDIHNIIKEIEQQDSISIGWLQDWMIPFIYLLYEEKNVVYVGQSTGGISRLITHIKEENKFFTHFKIVTCESCQLTNIEADLIAYFLPKYNMLFPKNSKWAALSTIKRETKLFIEAEKSVLMRVFNLTKKILRNNEWINIVNLNGITYCSTKKYVYALDIIVKRGDKNNLKVDPMEANSNELQYQ